MPALAEAKATFAQRLKELREKAGLSQPELATRCGLSVWTLRGWEQGRRLPNCYGTLAILRALGVGAEAFGGCDGMESLEG
jgi:DNA-binding transcriptional regulator YiaG